MHRNVNTGRRWLSRLLPLLLVLAACSGQESVPVGTDVTTSQPDQSVPSSTPRPTSTTLAPGEVFSNGLTATSQNYRFESTVAAGDEVITSITGVVDKDAIAADISAGENVVSYVRTTDGEWMTDSNGEWVEMNGQPPVAPPLAQLADASSFQEVSADQGTVVLTGTLGPAAGAAGGIPFTVTITDGLIAQIQYQAETGGGTAVVTTAFTDIGSAGGVVRPDV